MAVQKIYYKKVRNFAEIFSAAFGYLKQNFKSFFGSILLFTVPLVIIITMLLTYVVSNTSLTSGYTMRNSSFAEAMLLIVAVACILALILQTVYITAINAHIIANEQLAQEEQLTVGVVGKRILGSFWRVFGNCILLGIFGFVFLLIYSVINSVLTGLLTSLGPLGIIISSLIQMMTSIILYSIISYFIISTLFVVQRDKVGAISGLKTVFKYLKNNFWKTWSVSIVSYLMTYICSAIAMIPAIVFIVLQVFSRSKSNGAETSATTIFIGAAIFMISLMLILCIYSVYFVMCNFQYASLEEKKEGLSIMDKINQIQ